MSKYDELLANPEFIGDLRDTTLSSRYLAEKYRVGKTFVNKQRAKTSLRASVAPQSAPEWSPVDRARPTNIYPLQRSQSRADGWGVAVVLPDPQIGFRVYEDGSLDPFHDIEAMSVALQIIEELNPDKVINLGDFLDLPSQGRWAQEASFARTTQLAIDAGHVFLAQQRAAAPNAEISLIEGNHDRRLQNFVETNALAAFGLKKANKPESWPVLSLPYLLRLDELNVGYIDAYPTGKVWINDTLYARHGDKVRSSGSTAAAYTSETPHISTVFGHTHRLEIQSRTTFDRVGKLRNMAISPGCLCRVDGGVPGVHSAIGSDGRPAPIAENWQQGVAVIHYTDTQFFVDLVQIEDGFTIFRGQEFRA
jgi:predicted phosphodiesterase